VIADVRREKGQTLAKERAETLLARAKEVGLEQAAAQAGVALDTTGAFERKGGTIPKLGMVSDLRTDAFALTTEAPLATKVYSAGSDAVVVALRSRTPADMTGFAAGRDALRDTVLEQKRQSTVTAYLTFLKERAQREGALDVHPDALTRG
jgi:hypothetical protein